MPPLDRRQLVAAAALCALVLPGVCAARGGGTGEEGSDMSSGAAINYAERILSALRLHLVPSGPVPRDVVAEVEIHVAPDGRITSFRLRTPSGSAVWDEAALRAVAKTQRLPLDAEGKIPAVLNVSFRRD
jgi:colicin import membrane protein